jgi:hypothetical protein
MVTGCSFEPGTLARDRDASADDAPLVDAPSGDAPSADAQTDFIIEAESFTTAIDGTAAGQEASWGSEMITPGYSAAAYMRVLPASGRTCVLANNECAQLVFEVPITVSATYYVHVRVLATGSSDNSLHYGIDGTPEANHLTLPETSTWTWMTGSSYVLAPGTHTLHLWQRESGTCADVVALTTSATPPP